MYCFLFSRLQCHIISLFSTRSRRDVTCDLRGSRRARLKIAHRGFQICFLETCNMSRDLRHSDKVNHIWYVRVPITTIVHLNISHAAWLHRMPAVFGPWSSYPRIPPGCAAWAKYQPPPKPSLTSRYLLYMISLPIFCLRLLTLIPNKALENTFFYRIISLFSSRRSFWRMLIVTCIKTMSLFGDVRTYPSWLPKTTCTTTRHNPQKNRSVRSY